MLTCGILLKRLREFGESLFEVLLITKACLTTFWFWLPPLFAAYMYFQLWMIFFIHPLTILIVPVVLAIFAMIINEERVKAQYGLDKVKLLKVSDPLGAGATWKKVRWDVEKGVREYKLSLKMRKDKKAKEND